MESLWEKKTTIPEYPSLKGNLNTDVLVIGGGIAGLLTAYCLAEKGADTVLVEKGRICSGTTARTTAKITVQHGLIYSKLVNKNGTEYAKMYYKANAEAARRLKQLCRSEGCAIENKTNYICSSDLRRLEEELTALQKIGVEALFRRQLPVPIKTAGAVGIENQAQFNPLELAKSLSGKIKKYENTKVEQITGTTAITSSGMINAHKIVIATHFPFINRRGLYFIKLYQHRSYVLALKGAGTIDGMYVEDSMSGLSLSSFGDIILLGGGGHRTGKQGGSYTALRQFKDMYFSDAEEFCHWAAQDTISLDSVPYIGRYSPNMPDVYVAAGFNKWGMTGSMAAAHIISSMICGRLPDYAPVFSPSRGIFKPQLMINGIETVSNFILPSARRCPHMGCVLKYNKEERSWDCPCHGSRFSESGKLLDNPANEDL